MEDTTFCGNKVARNCTAESGSGCDVVSSHAAAVWQPDTVVEDNLKPVEHVQDAVPHSPAAPLHAGSGLGEALVTLELCAGSAMLSAILKRDGFDAIAVDFSGNRHRPHMHVLSLDLRLDSTWRFLEYAVFTRVLFHCHAGPPCGTCSRARGIKLPDGRDGPKPLRSEQYPEGFPWLVGEDQKRVHSANLVYLKLCRFIRWLDSLSIGFTVENPTNSLLWWIPEYVAMEDISFFINFDSCMFGSERLKRTTFLTNVHELKSMEVACDNSHTHKPWGMVGSQGSQQFATSEEAAYPKPLCEAFAECLKLRARSLGYDVDALHLPSANNSRIAAQQQPRRKTGKPLMSEFHYTQTVQSQSEPVLNHKSMLQTAFCEVPINSKLIRRVRKMGENGPETCYTFGIYRSPMEFLRDAKLLQHPFDTTCALPDSMLVALGCILRDGALEVMKRRIQILQQWSAWKKELEPQEVLLHKQLPASVSKVLKDKNLLLLERIACSLGWKDETIHSEIRKGFKLTGNPLPSGIFELDFKPALMEEQELIGKMKYMKPALWSKIASLDEQEFSQALWDLTMDECEKKNWLQGPFSWQELEQRHEGQWMPCRRFAVWQSHKWRPIDDLSENGVNSAFSVCERIDLKALDETIWVAMTLMRYIRDKGHFNFPLSDGRIFSGKVHGSWMMDLEDGKPFAKTMDLKSAYKQWALAPSDIPKAIITLKQPGTGSVVGFECLTLPFGAVSSVLAFNRIARSYQRILHEVNVVAANYFDDYPIIEMGALTANTERTLRAVSKLLGFEVAFDKDEPFSRRTDMLGVTLDLQDDELQNVLIANKASRIADMRSALEKILQDGFVHPASLPSLFGRLQFCEAQLLGRQGRLAMADIRSLERAKGHTVKLDDDQRDAFLSLLDRLKESVPRTISSSKPTQPVLVFTDGACEPKDGDFIGSVGGVMIVPFGKSFSMRVFGGYMPRSLMNTWSESGKKHLIGPVELYAVGLARSCWSSYLDNRALFFIDHGGVLAALISGSSRDSIWRHILLKIERSDAITPCLAWYARVASASNISDGPSRGEWELLKDCEFTRDYPRCFLTGEEMNPT